MRTFVDCLIGGPDWTSTNPMASWRWLACLPLLSLFVLVLSASMAGLLHTAVWPNWQALLLAASATLVCFALALPSAISGPASAWIVPLWLAPSIGVAGWALLPLPPGPFSTIARAVALTLPVMVFALSGAWATLPAGLSRAAAAAGAGPPARGRVLLRHGLRGALGACLLVFIIALQLT